MLSNGQPCTIPGQCHSGHCADGVCCDMSCNSSCRSCKVSGRTGQCVSVPFGGSPPAGKACTATPSNTCGRDGKCDGLGNCRHWAAGTECAARKCSSSEPTKVTPARFCDGLGKCLDTEALFGTIDCKEYRCDSQTKACRTSCTKDSHCKSGKICKIGKCAGKAKPLGASCSSKIQCESGKCVNGVCCESDCVGACSTCIHPGVEGLCIDIPNGSLPRAGHSCPVTPHCGEDGRCNGSGKCRKAPAGSYCSSTQCVPDGKDYVLISWACKGDGKCEATKHACGNFACQPGGKSCYGRCETNAQCKTGLVCKSTICTL